MDNNTIEVQLADADDVPIQGCDTGPGTECGDQSAVRLGRSEIRGLLDRLVEQSLVSVHITADTVRYFLLESLRLFAADRLAERSAGQADEPARLACRHCYYYRDKVVHAQAEWFGPAEQALLSWAAGAWSNIGRAIETSMVAGEPVVGCKSPLACWRFARRSTSVRCPTSAAASSRRWRPPKHHNPS